jgi:hypothetical protein
MTQHHSATYFASFPPVLRSRHSHEPCGGTRSRLAAAHCRYEEAGAIGEDAAVYSAATRLEPHSRLAFRQIPADIHTGFSHLAN